MQIPKTSGVSVQKDLREKRGQLWAVGSESRAQIRSRDRRGMVLGPKENWCKKYKGMYSKTKELRTERNGRPRSFRKSEA